MYNYLEYPVNELDLKEPFYIYHIKQNQVQDIYMHHHDFFEVYLLLQGDLDYIVNGYKYEIKNGDLIVLLSNQLHRPIFKNQNQTYERYVLWIKKDIFSIENLKSNENTAYIKHLSDVERSAIISIFDMLKMQVDQQHNKKNQDIVNKCIDLVASLINQIYSDYKPIETSLNNDGLQAALDYIDRNAYQKITLDELSNISHISKYHLSRKFKEKVGTNIYQYCIKKRLLLSKNLISHHLPMAQVQERCGFSDYASFYRAFKKEYKISPRDYLKRHEKA
ncbi:MAG: helix-turn-helix domain-containing protein [Clostridia bacterium]|nr:helix-turn-helix domain-containing protein [Clostridia bacterium]